PRNKKRFVCRTRLSGHRTGRRLLFVGNQPPNRTYSSDSLSIGLYQLSNCWRQQVRLSTRIAATDDLFAFARLRICAPCQRGAFAYRCAPAYGWILGKVQCATALILT